MNALTRKRPIPGGAMAKLHSLVPSNSLVCVHDGADHSGTLLRTQGTVRLRPDFPVDLDRGRKAGGNEQIRALLLDHAPQQILH